MTEPELTSYIAPVRRISLAVARDDSLTLRPAVILRIWTDDIDDDDDPLDFSFDVDLAGPLGHELRVVGAKSQEQHWDRPPPPPRVIELLEAVLTDDRITAEAIAHTHDNPTGILLDALALARSLIREISVTAELDPLTIIDEARQILADRDTNG